MQTGCGRLRTRLSGRAARPLQDVSTVLRFVMCRDPSLGSHLAIAQALECEMMAIGSVPRCSTYLRCSALSARSLFRRPAGMR